MKKQEFIDLFEGTSDLSDVEGCFVLLGLNLIAKYLPLSGVESAMQDQIWACCVDDLIKAGITTEDTLLLVKWDWMIEEDYLCCWV